MHKKCTNIHGKLSADPSFRCNCCRGLAHRKLSTDPSFRYDCCRGLAHPNFGKQCNQMVTGTHELETVDLFGYLGDSLCAGDGCVLASITRTRSVWKKFKELLHLLSSRSFSFNICRHVCNSHIRSTMLYACECWPSKKEDPKRL